MNNIARIVTVPVLCTGLVFFSCKKVDENTSLKIQPVDVKIEIIKPTRLVDAIQVAGTVKAFEDVNISPEEGGVIKEWIAQKGQHVKKGDLIVTLKDEVIKAGYDAAEAQYRMADLNVEKQQKVFEQQGISDLQMKNFQYGRDAAKANADLMKARWERTQIRSTIDGVVENTPMGNLMNEGEFAPPGVPIVRIVNNSKVKIQAEVPELYSGTLPLGIPAVVTFDALPGDTLRGRVSFVSSAVSAANRTMQVELILSNPFRKLKPEMVAKVKLLREAKNNAILVSENIVQLVDRDRIIVYVEQDGKAQERRLKLGGRQGMMMEVLDGLKIGDHLVVTGYQKLVDGTTVNVVK
ncbi:MAG: efflux RND transporter periplasmic adaptor subunit [Ignavibacteriales bacterium]|nr:efflux RND transporter periplasmic adaptor subunit [Ignavibacteriales bacterium]